MSIEEKAKELYNKFLPLVQGGYLNETYHTKAKQCAIIAVNELISELTEKISPSLHGFRHNYWEEVKKEIEKL